MVFMALPETIRKAEKEKTYIRQYGGKCNINTDTTLSASRASSSKRKLHQSPDPADISAYTGGRIRRNVQGGIPMIWSGIIGFILGIVLVIVYALEIHANNKRIERGEPPKKHHDITDWDIVPTIDLSRRERR